MFHRVCLETQGKVPRLYFLHLEYESKFIYAMSTAEPNLRHTIPSNIFPKQLYSWNPQSLTQSSDLLTKYLDRLYLPQKQLVYLQDSKGGS
jgi:hypothetical protein